ncbi:MAG TPA: HAMP domain-containing protein, partial [Proteobacteria bacterium]|nr:HAMP domain-containing protein [Pseudomonadota bacterium]
MRSSLRTPRRYGLLVKLVLSFVLLGAVFLLAFSAISYFYAKSTLEKEMDLRIISAARVVAKSVPYESLTLLVPGREGSQTHRSILRTLDNLKDALGAQRIFIFNPTTYRLLVDTKTRTIGLKYHRLLQDRAEIRLARQGVPSASIMFRGPKDRMYKSGYAAIEGPGGVIAVVGVEADVRFFDELATLKRAMVASLIAILVLLALTAFALARRIQKPVVELVDASNRIAEGKLGTAIDVSAKDEIGSLAATMEKMRRAILQRDENLRLLLRAIAHQIKNPLGSMRYSAELLAEDIGDDDRSSRLVSVILENIER